MVAPAQNLQRTSNLLAPTMLLSGHQGAVLSLRFSPDGQTLAAASLDRCLYLWRIAGEPENYCLMRGHKGPLLDLQWTADGERLVTASADKTVRAWDAVEGVQVKKLAEHSGVVNACCLMRRGPPLLATGSDDASAKVWDLRQKRSISTLSEAYPITAVAFSDAGDQVVTGGIDPQLRVWDLRKERVAFRMPGHSDSITGLRLSSEGSHLLSNAMDGQLRMWDMRPYAPSNRCAKVFTGHVHSFEKNLLRCDWSPDGTKITAGSADRLVNIWDVHTRQIIYKLPGHTGAVNEVVFHPTEPVVASGGNDKQIFVGELAAG